MKRFLPIILFLAMLVNGCSNLPHSTSPAAPSGPAAVVATLVPLGTPAAKYGGIARPLMSDLETLGPRVAGTDGETKAAQYIVAAFQALGYTPQTQPFTAAAGNQSINSANVVAVKTGTSSQEIVVGAHYDSTAASPGVDDNASGVAVMLEVAKLVKGVTTPYTIRFIAFGAEESGLLGSYAFLNQLNQDQFQNIVVMLDLDSLVAGDVAYAYSEETQSAARDWALEWALGNGFDLQTIRNVSLTFPDTKGIGSSDYAPFQAVGIPFIYFNSTDWSLGDKKGTTQVDTKYGEDGVIRHTRFDTLSYLDSNFPGRVDQRLNMYIAVVSNLLTQYEAPAP